MMSKYFILAAVIAILGFTSQTWADDDDCPKGNIQGEWLAQEIVPTPGGELMPSLPCYRMYACVSYNEAHGQQTMGNADCERIYTNPPARRKVSGVCSAAGGPADSCNECLTNPPDDACEYHYKHD